VRLNETEINGMVNTFGERPVGEIIALIGSTGNLGIAVVNGNAAAKLGVKPGDEVLVMT
jgi:S-adenosyl-L-methionine hydrolase (adenosine-forming)